MVLCSTIFEDACQQRSQCQNLLHMQVGIAVHDRRIRDVYTFPGKAADLAKAQRAGKGKMDGHEQFPVFTGIQSLTDSLLIPDRPELLLVMGEGGTVKGILADHAPADCLLKGGAHGLVDLHNGAGSDILAFGPASVDGHGLRPLQSGDEPIHSPGVHILNQHIPPESG